MPEEIAIDIAMEKGTLRLKVRSCAEGIEKAGSRKRQDRVELGSRSQSRRFLQELLKGRQGRTGEEGMRTGVPMQSVSPTRPTYVGFWNLLWIWG